MSIYSSGRKALGRTLGLSVYMARHHPYAVGGTAAAGAGLYGYERHRMTRMARMNNSPYGY